MCYPLRTGNVPDPRVIAHLVTGQSKMLRQEHCSESQKSIKTETAVTLLEVDLAHMGGCGVFSDSCSSQCRWARCSERSAACPVVLPLRHLLGPQIPRTWVIISYVLSQIKYLTFYTMSWAREASMALTDAKMIVIEENLIHLIVVEDKGQEGLKVEPAGSPVSCSASDRCWEGGD